MPRMRRGVKKELWDDPIVCGGDTQQDEALASKAAAAMELGVPEAAIKVEIKPLTTFWKAEEYHQNYKERNTIKYNYYRWACGRDRKLDDVWGSRARTGDEWGEPSER